MFRVLGRHRTQNTEHRTQNTEHRTQNTKLRTTAPSTQYNIIYVLLLYAIIFSKNKSRIFCYKRNLF